MQIIWTDTAIRETNNIILYITENWNDDILIKFFDAIDNAIELIKDNPSIGVHTGIDNNRKILIVKQVYMVYDLTNGVLEIKSMWNNSRKPIW